TGRLSLVANCLQIKNRSGYAERGGPKKIWLRSKFPKIRAEESGNADNQIANQIIRADHLPAPLRFAVADDQRLARSIAKFFKAANSERNHERGETSRDEQTDREQREHDEGHDDEGFAAVPVGVMRRGN